MRTVAHAVLAVLVVTAAAFFVLVQVAQVDLAIARIGARADVVAHR